MLDMRLISQDGTKDIPYEESAINIIPFGNDGNHRISAYIDGFQRSLGYYSTKEKALKVMKELREDWKDGLAFFYFPADEEVEV